MHAPQIIWIAIQAAYIGTVLQNEKLDWHHILGLTINVGLLYWGGFFSH